MLRDARDTRTYTRFAYILLALPLAILYFTVLVSGLSAGIGAAVTLLGIPVLIGTMFAWRWMAALERVLARSLLAEDIPSPYRLVPSGAWWPRLRVRLTDPATWKDLAYLLLLFPLALFTFVVAVTLVGVALGLLFAPAWYWALPNGIELGAMNIDTVWEALAAIPVGAVLALASLRVVNWLGALHGAFARVMLGPSSDPELEAQVVDLSTARSRIIAAADDERRRLERNLHDGAQQRLVALSLTLGLARRQVESGDDAEVRERLTEAEQEARLAIDELRELARGIHPAILTSRGLDAALAELSGRAAVPVTVDGEVGERLAPEIEAAAYFTISEALANVGKYAEASEARVRIGVREGTLDVVVADDGRGGADPGSGSGLRGLIDRVGAVGGTFQIDSPPGGGTTLTAHLPLAAPAPTEADALDAPPAPSPERRRRFAVDHAAVFAVVNGLLVAIWAVTGAGYFWPIWPLMGWGAVLALHWVLAVRRRPAAPPEGDFLASG
jgi:signal transduction histidine kinase